MGKRIEDFDLDKVASLGETAWQSKVTAIRFKVDKDVMRAMKAVSRWKFVQPCMRALPDVSDDEKADMLTSLVLAGPLPIYGNEYWINSTDQALTAIILMSAAKNLDTRHALVIGSGCGYAPAVLRRMGYDVTGLEIEPTLAQLSAQTLWEQGFNDVTILNADVNDWVIYSSDTRFDAIAAFCAIPMGHPLVNQLIARLSPGGRFVAPIGPSQDCAITMIDSTGMSTPLLEGCEFIGLR